MRRRWAIWLGLGCAAVACSYYDPSLLEPIAGQSEGGSGGEAGSGGSGETSGSGGSGGTSGSGGQAGSAGKAGEAGASGQAGQAGSAGQAGASGQAGQAGQAGSAGSMCTHAVPPDPPTGKDLGGNTEIVLAATKVEFGDADTADGGASYKHLGYDLDGRCTCEGETSSCKLPDGNSGACDGDDGRDNGGGAFISDVKTHYFSNFGTEVWEKQIKKGAWSLLLRVRNYNGMPDDDSVELTLLVPASFDTFTPDAVPKFDGTDVWPIKSLSYEQGAGGADGGVNEMSPRYIDKNAYVSGGTLVASLPNGVLQVSAEFSVTITGAFLTAKLVPPSMTTNYWTMQNGVLAARWQAKDILGQLGNFNDPFTSSPICTNNPIYSAFKAKICSATDIYSGVGAPTTPCDSLSVGIGFEGVAAKTGKTWVSPVKTSPCAPENDPAKDTCATP